jgi:acyl carrier protein
VNQHQQLEEVFREVFNLEDLILADATTAQDIPGWDSVAHINLMFSIEQAFNVRFNGNELAEFKNIGELKAFLDRAASLKSSG